MKSLVFVAGIFCLIHIQTVAANAAPTDPTVTVTSFVNVGDTTSQLGEVCGTVKNMVGATTNLDVIADYNTNSPGAYHTFAGSDGNFCQLIRTLNGTVEVNITGQPATQIKKAL